MGNPQVSDFATAGFWRARILFSAVTVSSAQEMPPVSREWPKNGSIKFSPRFGWLSFIGKGKLAPIRIYGLNIKKISYVSEIIVDQNVKKGY